MERKPVGMEAIFNPRSVAVVGASDNPEKLGSHVMKSLTQGGYPGKIFPINPGKDEILGIKTYRSLLHVPEEVDLSIIVLPAEQVPKTIKECKEKGIHGIILNLQESGMRKSKDLNNQGSQTIQRRKGLLKHLLIY